MSEDVANEGQVGKCDYPSRAVKFSKSEPLLSRLLDSIENVKK